MEIRVKKLGRRLCNVRGCRNIGSYAIARSREVGSSMIICEACLRDALAAVEAMKPTQVEADTLAETEPKAETTVEKAVEAPKEEEKTAATAKPKATSKAKTAAKSTAKSK